MEWTFELGRRRLTEDLSQLSLPRGAFSSCLGSKDTTGQADRFIAGDKRISRLGTWETAVFKTASGSQQRFA